MTLPEDVASALETLIAHCPSDLQTYVETIRAHLLSRDASITNLRSAAQKAVLANADLRSHLVAAEALLQVTRYQWPNLNGALHNAIDVYLQGDSNETCKD